MRHFVGESFNRKKPSETLPCSVLAWSTRATLRQSLCFSEIDEIICGIAGNGLVVDPHVHALIGQNDLLLVSQAHYDKSGFSLGARTAEQGEGQIRGSRSKAGLPSHSAYDTRRVSLQKSSAQICTVPT